MKPGQRLTRWWQEYVLGRLRTPQDIFRSAWFEEPDKMEDRFTQDVPEDRPFDAPARLRAPMFLRGESYAKQMLRADWQQVDERLSLLFARVVLAARKRGIPLYVHSAFRTKVEQDALVARKVTKAQYPRSAHNIGEGVDLVHGVYHWELSQDEWRYLYHLVMEELRKFNAALPKAKKLHLNWGGDDGTPEDRFRWDPAHWEIVDYRDRIRSLPVGPARRLTPDQRVKFP